MVLKRKWLSISVCWNKQAIPSSCSVVTHILISYKVTSPPLGINEIGNADFALSQNQPNPFSTVTSITYDLAKSASKVSLEIFDVTGAKVFENVESNQKSGSYSVNVSNVKFTPGVYFYSLTVDGAKVTKKMIAQ